MNKDNEGKSNIYRYVLCGLMAAIICLFAPISVPIGPIPVSLTNLVLYIAVYILSVGDAMLSLAVYMLIGIAGLPVFSGYSGGIAKLAGPTGGYLVGFFPMLLILGIVFLYVKKMKSPLIRALIMIVAGVLATGVLYALGTVWFVYQMECTWEYALSVCVIPFIPFDIGKIIIANIVGPMIRKPLSRLGLV